MRESLEVQKLTQAPDVLVGSTNTFEIMRILEDVIVNATHAPDLYLGQLERYLRRLEHRGTLRNGSDSKEGKADYGAALRKLEEVRLACARNLARAMVLNVNDQY